MANVKRFNYRPNNCKEGRKHGVDNINSSLGGDISHSGASKSTSQAGNRKSKDNVVLTRESRLSNSDGGIVSVPSKRIRYSDSSNASMRDLQKTNGLNGTIIDINLEDDDFESALTSEDFDQIEIAATQALSKTGQNRGSISTNLFDSTVSDSSRNSVGMHEPSQTLQLFASTNVPYANENSKNMSALEKIAILEKQLRDYDLALKREKDKQYQKDGEIKILRLSLEKAKEDKRQQSRASMEVDLSRRASELERERNHKKEIESLKTQLQFKTKEVDEALLRARVSRVVTPRKVRSAIELPETVDVDLLLQPKSKHKNIQVKDASEQTDSQVEVPIVSGYDLIGLENQQQGGIDALLQCLHTGCAICQQHSTSSGSGSMNRKNSDTSLNISSMFTFCTHTIVSIQHWSKYNPALLFKLTLPMIYLLKQNKDFMANDLVVKHMSIFNVLDKDLSCFFAGTDSGQETNSATHSKDDAIMIYHTESSAISQLLHIVLMNLELFFLVCQEIEDLNCILVSAICFVTDNDRYGQSKSDAVDHFRENWDIRRQHLSKTEEQTVLAFSISLISAVSITNSMTLCLFLGKILTMLLKTIHPGEEKERLIMVLAREEILASILNHQSKDALAEGTEMLCALSNCGGIKDILCNEKDNCPLLRILLYCVSKPDWLQSWEWMEFKLRVIQSLSSAFATDQSTLRQLLESECDCSQEFVSSLILMLLPDMKIYLHSPRDAKNDQGFGKELTFTALRQGISLLVSVCLSDRFLIDHRAEVEREYFYLLHGACRLFSTLKDIADSEVHAIHDLLEYDQYEEEEEVGEAVLGAEPMSVE